MTEVELKQTPYEDMLACSEGHLCAVIAIDESGSMAGGKLQAVIDGIERFKRANAADPLTLKRVDMCVLTFGGHGVRVLQDWTPMERFVKQPPLELSAEGTTPMGEAILRSLELTRERNRLYLSLGTPAFTPFVMLITDGLPSDSLEEAKKRLREREACRRVRLFCCGVGLEHTDMDTLAGISKRVIQCTDEGALSHLFDWMTESIAIISHSRTVGEGDEAHLAPLPQGFTVVPSDW